MRERGGVPKYTILPSYVCKEYVPREGGNEGASTDPSGLGRSCPALTCPLFFLAFSTDFTVSPAADRAAIRDSMSDIFKERKKNKQNPHGQGLEDSQPALFAATSSRGCPHLALCLLHPSGCRGHFVLQL